MTKFKFLTFYSNLHNMTYDRVKALLKIQEENRNIMGDNIADCYKCYLAGYEQNKAKLHIPYFDEEIPTNYDPLILSSFIIYTLDIKKSELASYIGVSLRSLEKMEYGETSKSHRLFNLYIFIYTLNHDWDTKTLRAFLLNSSVVIDPDDPEDGICSPLIYLMSLDRVMDKIPEILKISLEEEWRDFV